MFEPLITEADMRDTYYGDYSYMTRVQETRSRRATRARRVKRQKMFIVIGVLITLALCSFFSIKAFANTDSSSTDSFGTKQYKSVKIYCRDTVESIAEDNFSFQFSSVEKMAREIRSINHMSDDEELVPGNYIVVPYFSEASGY